MTRILSSLATAVGLILIGSVAMAQTPSANPSARLIDLGAPFSAFVSPSASPVTVGGATTFLAASSGYPAALATISMPTGRTLWATRMPGALAVYGHAQVPNGTVYLGASPSANLYAVNPEDGTVTGLGSPDPHGRVIWALTYDPRNGLVYGGLGRDAQLFSYDPSHQTFAMLGSMGTGHAFVRSVVYGYGRIFAGLGSPASLVEFNPATDSKRVLLPVGYSPQQTVSALQMIGNDLFVHYSGGEEVVLRYPSYRVIWKQPGVTSPGVSSEAVKGRVVYVAAGHVWAYDMSTNRSVDLSPGLANYGSAFLQFASESGLFQAGNGQVSGLTSKGYVWSFTPGSRDLTINPVGLRASVDQINTIGVAGGSVYLSSYLSGSTAVYTPGSGFAVDPGPGQGEAIAADGNRVLMGTYPAAMLWLEDPYRPWNWGALSQGQPNPTLIGMIGFQQDRPVALADSPDGTWYVGTVPIAGEIGGALSWFKGGKIHTVRNLIAGESPIALVWDRSLLVGATTVSGGIGAHPVRHRSFVIVWNPATNAVEHTTPFPVPAVTALCVGSNGTVYGLTHSELFAYDPVTGKVFAKRTFPWTNQGYGGFSWGANSSLILGPDGNLYGTVNGVLFEARRATLSAKPLVRQGVNRVVRDGDTLYAVVNGTELVEVTF